MNRMSYYVLIHANNQKLIASNYYLSPSPLLLSIMNYRWVLACFSQITTMNLSLNHV
jgi:hypothetical protein